MLLKDSSMREYIKPWANSVCHMANVETWRLSLGREAREGCFQHPQGALPRGVLTSKSLLQIWKYGLVGRKEQDGGAFATHSSLVSIHFSSFQLLF